LATDDRAARCPFTGDYAAFDHHSPHHRETAESVWKRMRAEPHLPRSECHGGFYVVSRHAQVRSVAAQHKVYSSAQGVALPSEERTRHVPEEVDPPLQREYRRLLDPFLTPDRIAAHEGLVRSIATELLDALAGQSRVEIVSRFTEPFPVYAALAIFGFPRADADRLNGLVNTLVTGRGNAAGRKASAELTDYLVGQLQERGANNDPVEDIVAAIARGSVQGHPLSLEDQVSATRLLLFGGFTTVNLALSASLRVLAQRPELAERLRNEPHLYPTAIEEFVRYAAPGTYLRRVVVSETELGGTKLLRGDQVLLSFGAANRDPDAFRDPDQVIIDRNPNPHVGFGFGTHRCMGSSIAKLEMRVALEAILGRYERIEIDPEGQVAWGQGETQGLTSLPLILTARHT
jgi:cytochrome P450